MKGKRLDNAFAAARSAVERLRDGDVVSIVTYNSKADVLVDPTVIDATSRARVLRALSKPVASGETCISCAVDASMRLVSERTGMVERILLVSDGFADVGTRDVRASAASPRTAAGWARRSPRSASTSSWTSASSPRSPPTSVAAAAREPDGLDLLDEEVGFWLERTVANNATMVVDLSPGVELEQVFNRANQSGSSQVIIPLGAFSSTDEKTLLLRVRVPRSATGNRPVASIHLHYDNLANSKEGQCDGELGTRVSADPSQVTPLDALVSARVSASETAEALEQANDQFRAGNTAAATQIIQQQQMNMHMHHMAADKSAPMGRMNDVDAGFEKQEKALGAATGGFAEPTATATPDERARVEHEGKKQMKDNEKNAFDASE